MPAMKEWAERQEWVRKSSLPMEVVQLRDSLDHSHSLGWGWKVVDRRNTVRRQSKQNSVIDKGMQKMEMETDSRFVAWDTIYWHRKH